ncbi:hypothetical protein Acr_01g0012960 [Actinidia rufa]|uniref:Retrotransposon gag domain-containing protein n=1 Tax=Actinidia rufa TaxID=165716 RepID=A0A7J0E761_9ERIC|nr:hypothetical protein Acr_01g0012960 [Actinidia rufa]
MHYRLTEMVNTRSSGQGNRPPQPQQPRDQYSDGGENQTRGETSEYRGETEDPAIPVENVAIVKQFLKLKPPTFSGEMDPVKANEWLLEMEKNFRLLRCGEQQKVEIDSYLLTGAASRWWNLKGVREPGMNWARFKVIFKEKYVPRALQNAKCAEFEHLKQTGKPIAEYEAAFTSRICSTFVGHIIRNCPKLETGAIVPRGNQGGGNARPGGNRQGNQGNRSGTGNNQRQGQVFALMPGDAKNDEIVVTGNILICSLPAYVLFDTGSSHTFVSTKFASRLNKKPEPLGYELAVSQPMNKGIVCSTVYRDCSVCIGDTVIPTDLSRWK